MKVTISGWQEQENCSWCEKSRDCVTTDFDDGFLKNVAMCWSCLAQAIKVRSRSEQPQAAKAKPRE